MSSTYKKHTVTSPNRVTSCNSRQNSAIFALSALYYNPESFSKLLLSIVHFNIHWTFLKYFHTGSKKYLRNRYKNRFERTCLELPLIG